MKFIDEVLITVKAGKGGDGCVSFRREKYIPKGGPDGGNGGNGGSIFIKASKSINTLVDYRCQRYYQADCGHSGSGRMCTGRKGKNLYLSVPIGTKAYLSYTQQKIGEVLSDDTILKLAEGGKGGIGNVHFKSSINQTPRKFSFGEDPLEKEIRLELTLLADIGLLGLPNSGKSTLMRGLSSAKPKVADYPFTTIYPNLGVVKVGLFNSFIMADIPGIIEGASWGAGLGLRFLKHLTKTKYILHLIDVLPIDGSDPVNNYHIIEDELKKYSYNLYKKPRCLVLNKIDQWPEKYILENSNRILKKIGWNRNRPYFIISGLLSKNTQNMINKIMIMLKH